jgi:hypothetical protein
VDQTEASYRRFPTLDGVMAHVGRLVWDMHCVKNIVACKWEVGYDHCEGTLYFSSRDDALRQVRAYAQEQLQRVGTDLEELCVEVYTSPKGRDVQLDVLVFRQDR